MRYWPPRLSAEQQQAWFRQLLEAVPWQQERRQMYERMLDVPRLHASLPVAEAYVIPAVLGALQLAQEAVQAPLPVSVSTSTAMDRIAWPCTTIACTTWPPAGPIVLVSLGHARDMLLRAKDGSHFRPLQRSASSHTACWP